MSESNGKNNNLLGKIVMALVPVALIALVTAAIVNSKTLAVQYKALEYQQSESVRQGKNLERLEERVRILELQVARIK